MIPLCLAQLMQLDTMVSLMHVFFTTMEKPEDGLGRPSVNVDAGATSTVCCDL